LTIEADDFTQRLAEVQGPRRGLARVPMLVGSLLAPLGLLLIALGWMGAAHTPVPQEEIAYGISGGLIGLGLVVMGSFLYFSHWQTQQIRETRAQGVLLTGELRQVRQSLAALAVALTSGPAPTLVATPSGTLSHLGSCSVVAARDDLVPAAPTLAACRICQPS
jgi:hypothetical protein